MTEKERRPGGRPTRAEAAALDDRVLDGARSIFGRKGVASATLEEIALELGISKHTIYRRYASKAALLEAVVERDIGAFRAALSEAAGATAAPLEALRRTALRYLELGSARDYAAFYLSVTAEAAFSPVLRARLSAWSEAALEPLTAAILAAQAAGDLRAGDPLTIRDILVDLLEGANNRVRLGGEAVSNEGRAVRLFAQRWDVFTIALGTGLRSAAAEPVASDASAIKRK